MRMIALLSIGLLLLAGCVPLQTDLSPLPAATAIPAATDGAQPPSDATMAGLVGRAVTLDGTPITGTSVSLAQVFWNEDRSDGAFVLNAAASPITALQEDGVFRFTNVLPAEYVVVVGDPVGANVIVAEPDGQARVIELVAGETLDIGDLRVAWSSRP
ncbi:MAG: hypothetical protein BWY52_02554 [Chloroflexi bacterium ADurb.Bin325]|nr:MAG: hypothetical protein BWY52_02554 [Chloroflexi bacterium ADurb.Bin325]